MFVIMEKVVDNRMVKKHEDDKFEPRFTMVDGEKANKYVTDMNNKNKERVKVLNKYWAEVKEYQRNNPYPEYNKNNMDAVLKKYIKDRDKVIGPMPEYEDILNEFYVVEVPEL